MALVHNGRYVISKGYRFVLPYVHVSRLKVKEHEGNVVKVLQVYFPSQRGRAIEDAIDGGRLLCNDKPVLSPEDMVYRNDVLAFTLHRHETEVLAGDMDILHLSDELVVVNKLSSIPVHPTGNFWMNSVQKILKYEHSSLLEDKDLSSVHRIDRLASGVLIFARTRSALLRLSSQFRHRSVDKVYLARVKGEFPGGVVEVKEPIAPVQMYPISHVISPTGKPSYTVFERVHVSSDGSQSVVICRPVTGRPHQIRVHLQWLGHPIANDYKYGGDLSLSCHGNGLVVEPQCYNKVSWCAECVRGRRETGHVSWGDLQSTCIWLHALRYSHSHSRHGWKFEAPWPSWSAVN